MVKESQKETFIPCSRHDLIELCLMDDQFSNSEKDKFRDFCHILSAYYHFKFHYHLETIKKNFAPFDPDKESQYNSKSLDSITQKKQETDLVETFIDVLEKANYHPLSKSSLERAFAENSLFDLKTEVDFNDFKKVVCYCRGDIYRIIHKKKFFRKVTETLNLFERVVLLIQFKEEKHFKNKPSPKEQLTFKPGKIYVYLYKDLSKADVEFIFPNIKMSMTWKDRLLFGIPAIGAGVSLIIRVLPQLLLILGVIIYVTLGHQPIEELQVQEEEVRNFTPLLVTILSLIITLGGFAFKQYTSYKNKQIKFQKNVTETLFFRNMASNVGVFQHLIDAAEEEECKEIILVYYHLLTTTTPLTPPELDARIEDWMEKKLGVTVDFDIDNTLKSLELIYIKDKQNNQNKSLLTRNKYNHCKALTLDEAKQVIDYVWDNIFQYS